MAMFVNFVKRCEDEDGPAKTGHAPALDQYEIFEPSCSTKVGCGLPVIAVLLPLKWTGNASQRHIPIGCSGSKLFRYRRPMVLLMNPREVLLGTRLIEESSREFLVPPATLEVETQLCRVSPRRDEVRSAERR